MLLGLPLWAWILLVVAVLLFLWARSYYARFRGACRTVREELAVYVPEQYPGAEVLREEMGNLVVRMPDGDERLWEMADLYADVARLPGMGGDPPAREALYRRAAAELFPLAPDAGRPLRREEHGPNIRPQLVRPDALPAVEGLVRRPLSNLGLEEVFVLQLPAGTRCLTAADLDDLKLDSEGVHALSLENLRKDFPADLVTTARSSDSGSAVQFGDSFDAARLLLVPEHLEAGEVVVALVPHRDLLVLLPAAILEDRERFDQGLTELACEDHPPLLTQGVRVTREGFEPV